MAHYLVRARLKPDRAAELRDKLDAGAFDDIRPFGRAMSGSLRRARRDPSTGDALWEEECYCTPPLAAERATVLDAYFDNITTEQVAAGDGWRRLDGLPPLWD